MINPLPFLCYTLRFEIFCTSCVIHIKYQVGKECIVYLQILVSEGFDLTYLEGLHG